MKKYILLVLALASITVYGQDPNIVWDRVYGGTDAEFFFTLTEDNDGGYVLAGSSTSDISGNKTDPSNGSTDTWVVKIDTDGTIQWQNSLGGNSVDDATSIVNTDDGGYILIGFSLSNISGDKSENSRGGEDYWLVKLDSSGNLVWDKTIGGSFTDWIPKIVKSSQGTYFIGGTSYSDISGDKTENTIGSADFWVLKIDDLGNILWQDTINGSESAGEITMASTNNGGVIIGGGSNSNISGDKTENSKGGYDYWFLKLNSEGSIEWDKTIGGAGDDYLTSIIQTADGGYLLGGQSESNISGDKTEDSLGGEDYWIVKTDANGNIQWQNTIGGNERDFLPSIFQTNDGGYFIGGNSDSNISGDKNENSQGERDYWVVKLNSSGFIEWQNSIGGSGTEFLFSVIQDNNGSYILGGFSNSPISGDKTVNPFGSNDYWIVKLNDILGFADNGFLEGLALYPNPSNNIIQLSATNLKIDGVKIYTTEGKLVKQTEGFENSKTLDISKLSSGIYFVQFTSGKQIATKKFVKQ